MVRMGWLLLFAVACKPDPKDSDTGKVVPGDDTAVDSDDSQDSGDSQDSDTGVPCTTQVLELTPADGATGVYYRDAVTAAFDGDGSTALFTLSGGPSEPYSPAWSDGNLKATFDMVLAPDTTYTFTASICDSSKSVSFTTSHLGTPIAMDPMDLKDVTWKFRLSDDAEITEPAFLDVLASQYVTQPLLVGVTYADATTIDLLGALGFYQETDATYYQDTTEVPWDFPAADFTDSPYFSVTASDVLTLSYNGIAIPIQGFHLEGTIAEDASYIGEGKAWGLMDTRNAGAWVAQPGVESAVCDIASSAGVTCEACDDGEPYCMFIRAEHIHADQVPVVIDPNP